jgi:succinylglutamate desuccinylase
MIARYLAPYSKRNSLSLLEEFRSFQELAAGPIDDSVTLDFGSKDPHIFFSFLIHGDEIGSFPAMNFFIREALKKRLRYEGKISFILGNPLATSIGERFIDEDLNRVFFRDLKENELTYERRRAFQIQKALQEADFLLDFHQTREPSQSSFFIFPFETESYFWARSIGGASYFVTQEPGSYFSPGFFSIDEYFRDLKKPSLCLELGQKGFSSDAFFIALSRIHRSLYVARKKRKSFSKFLENVIRSSEFRFLKLTHSVAFKSSHDSLRSGIYNFKKISKEAFLGSRHSGEMIQSPAKGFALFPKYLGMNKNFNEITSLSSPMLMLAEELQEHPLALYKSHLEKTGSSLEFELRGSHDDS